MNLKKIFLFTAIPFLTICFFMSFFANCYLLYNSEAIRLRHSKERGLNFHNHKTYYVAHDIANNLNNYFSSENDQRSNEPFSIYVINQDSKKERYLRKGYHNLVFDDSSKQQDEETLGSKMIGIYLDIPESIQGAQGFCQLVMYTDSYEEYPRDIHLKCRGIVMLCGETFVPMSIREEVFIALIDNDILADTKPALYQWDFYPTYQRIMEENKQNESSK